MYKTSFRYLDIMSLGTIVMVVRGTLKSEKIAVIGAGIGTIGVCTVILPGLYQHIKNTFSGCYSAKNIMDAKYSQQT